MNETIFNRRTFAHPNCGIGELFGLLVDFYEAAGSLDALDPLTREELEVAFNAVLKRVQERQGAYLPEATR